MRGLAILFACAVAGRAFALPAHYVVFEVDSDGQPQPVFHALVEITADGERASRVPPLASGGEIETFAWRPVRDGVVGEDQVIEVPRFLRAEFSRDPEHGDHHIEHHHHVEAEQRSFVLRVPVDAADVIELVGDRSLQRFDLAALARDAGSLPLAEVTPAQLLENADAGLRGTAGSPANRVDILLLGDGYTSAEQATFNAHADALWGSMFNVSPYKEYANFVNWATGFTASPQSGADHPPYQAGCNSLSCCADGTAQNDPRAGMFVNTAFDGRFCTNQIHRLLSVNSSKVLAAAAGYPDWDVLLVTVNDPVYGGAGGSISVTSAHTSGPLVVIHEYAHTFHKLADEYTSPYPGFPACNDTGAVPNCEANVTNQTVRDQVKWRHWYDPSNIAVPTPAGTPGTGLFEGARYLTSGMYRPTNTSCLMRSLGTTFCTVCRQAYVKRLYSGWGGVPSGGIDMIEPGGESPSPAAPVLYAAGTDRHFHAEVLRPETGIVAVQWLLDGVPIPGANTEHLVFNQTALTPATRTLQLRVTDQSPFVHAQMTDGLMEHTRNWTIQVLDDVLFADDFD